MAITKARQLAELIANSLVDSDEISVGAVTTSKLADTLDFSSKTMVMADNQLSGDKIHGGTISAFSSTGIDDNASSTAVTILSSGNVGIGTDSPDTKFQIGNGVEASNRLRFFVPNLVSLGAGIQFYVASTEYFNIDYNSDTNKLLFNTDTTFGSNIHLMSLDRQNRRVGIGTDSPVALLDVSDSTSNEPQIRLTTATATNYLSIARDSSTGHYEFKSEENGSAISFHTDPDGTGSQNRLLIDRYGQTVIGEYNVANGYTPYGQLTVRKNVDNGPAAATNVSDLDDATLVIHNQDTAGTGNKAALVFAHAGSPGVPSAIVSTKQNGSWRTHLSFYTNNITGGASTGVMQEQMRIDHDGNVSIGSSDDNPFSWGGSSNNVSITSAGSNDWAQLSLKGNGTGGTGINLGAGSVRHGGIFSLSGSDLSFATNATNSGTTTTERMTIKSGGNIGIGTTSPGARLEVRNNTNATDTILAGANLTTAGNYHDLIVGDGPNYAVGLRRYITQSNPSYLRPRLDFIVQGANTYLPADRQVRMTISDTGAVSVPGSLSKGSGSFKIDHPLDSLSDTHHLVHSFTEGPQADLIYRGKVQLVDGQANVNIDTASNMTVGTFEVLCRDVQCFTSNETGWTAVKGSVTGNILSIIAQDNTCTDTISWMVVGERKDPHMYDTDWTDSDGKIIVEPLKVTDHEG